jgi:tRNA(Ile2) C34 agmatinyltransferase TiaS
MAENPVCSRCGKGYTVPGYLCDKCKEEDRKEEEKKKKKNTQKNAVAAK